MAMGPVLHGDGCTVRSLDIHQRFRLYLIARLSLGFRLYLIARLSLGFESSMSANHNAASCVGNYELILYHLPLANVGVCDGMRKSVHHHAFVFPKANQQTQGRHVWPCLTESQLDNLKQK